MRLQILELPIKPVGESYETPFILVFSEVTSTVTSGQQLAAVRESYGSLREIPGCEHVFVTNDVVEIGPPPVLQERSLSKMADSLVSL